MISAPRLHIYLLEERCIDIQGFFSVRFNSVLSMDHLLTMSAPSTLKIVICYIYARAFAVIW